MAQPRDDEKAESRRIIERVERETDGGASLVGRTSDRLQKHLSADGVDDPIEKMGTRIGRILGFLITTAIVGWLIVYIVQGG